MTCRTPKKTRSEPGILLTGLETSKRSVDKQSKSKDQRNLNCEMVSESKRLLDAMNSDQMIEETLRLRQLNSTQNNQLTQLRRQISESSGGAQNDRLIRTLVDGLRAINIDIKPPKFEESQNPN